MSRCPHLFEMEQKDKEEFKQMLLLVLAPRCKLLSSRRERKHFKRSGVSTALHWMVLDFYQHTLQSATVCVRVQTTET